MANGTFTPWDGAPAMPVSSTGYAAPPSMPAPLEPWDVFAEGQYQGLREKIAALESRRAVAIANLTAEFARGVIGVDQAIKRACVLRRLLEPFDDGVPF